MEKAADSPESLEVRQRMIAELLPNFFCSLLFPYGRNKFIECQTSLPNFSGTA